jgi:hypothetical protein
MGLGTSKSKVKISLPEASEEEKTVTDVAVRLAEEQLAFAERQAEIADYLFENMPELFEAAGAAGALDEGALAEDLEALRAGTATPEQRDLISRTVENALKLGRSDIDRFTQEGLERVRDVLAPERGLRPGDSPILGLGSDIMEEGQRQYGNLVSSLRGFEAERLLNLPYERGFPITQLQAELAQNAFTNRLNLAGATGSLGLGMNPSFNVPQALSVIQQPRLEQKTIKGKYQASPMQMIGMGASAFSDFGSGISSLRGE